jgi:precorrin-3B methylase
MPLSIRETPQSVSVITRDSLEARQVQDLSQALETASGVNVYSVLIPSGAFLQIHGIALNGVQDIREDGFVSSTFFPRQIWRGDSPDLRIVPGITAMNSCASLVGAPLVHDFCTISLSDLLTPWPRRH